MLRAAVAVFTVAIVILLVLAALPERQQAIPAQQITLQRAQVTLYPEADPEAVWRFAAPRVVFDPEADETELHDVREGRREVGGETDFTVASERLLIDEDDNLRGEEITAFLVESGECLLMLAAAGESVVIDQQAGRFLVPLLQISGPSWGSDNRWERVRASFDLAEFEAGGLGTTTVNEFEVGADEGDAGRTICEES